MPSHDALSSMHIYFIFFILYNTSKCKPPSNQPLLSVHSPNTEIDLVKISW